MKFVLFCSLLLIGCNYTHIAQFKEGDCSISNAFDSESLESWEKMNIHAYEYEKILRIGKRKYLIGYKFYTKDSILKEAGEGITNYDEYHHKIECPDWLK